LFFQLFGVFYFADGELGLLTGSGAIGTAGLSAEVGAERAVCNATFSCILRHLCV
jgi:hypothetical protein